jgi:5-enolpyruvylshikimate-3-phosphate synthase
MTHLGFAVNPMAWATKETDQLHAIAVELSKMGIDIRERPDGLKNSRIKL